MNRRDTVLALLALGATSFTTDAQQGGKVYRIACVFPGSARTPGTVEYERSAGAFRQGLRELGYIEGRNIVIELKYFEGRRERFPALAKELVDLKPDLIVTASTPVTRAVSDATSTIPIVMATVLDPVAAAFVKNLARPAGDNSGLVDAFHEIKPKE